MIFRHGMNARLEAAICIAVRTVSDKASGNAEP